MADYCFGVILIARGKNGVYCAKRLKTPLTKANFTKMKSIGAGYKGKHYDTLFHHRSSRAKAHQEEIR